MSNRKIDLYKLMSSQSGLFDGDMENALNISLPFRDSLSKALRGCKDSRWIVAARISQLSGHSVSKDILDKFTSSNLNYGLRCEDLPAFCFVTNGLGPFEVLLNSLGCEVVDALENRQMKLARLEQKEKKLQEEIARLRHELRGHR